MAWSLYTFDVFDTLLTRVWLRPSDVFLHAAMVMRQRGLSALGAGEWRDLRVDAERRARQRMTSAEVSLEQIYGELGSALDWEETRLEAAKAIEIDCEYAAARPIGPVVRRFHRLIESGAAVACISDFYIGDGFVCDLLARNAVKVRTESVFVSCDRQLTKHAGTLFPAVAQRSGVSAIEILHTGDNAHSDVKMAKQAGFGVEPFTSGHASANEQVLRGRSGSAEQDMFASAIAGAARRARLERDLEGRDAELWNVATGIAGPLLFGYVYWILEESARRGVRRLYFLARDGQILLRIARHLESVLQTGTDLQYLHASRRAWFLPAAAQGSTEGLVAAVMADDSLLIADLLHRIGVDVDAAEPALIAAGFGARDEWRKPLSGARDLSRLRTVLQAPPFDEQLRRRAVQELDLATAYLAQHRVLDEAPFAIVDIGWKGRLQRSLAQILRGAGSQQRPIGFYLGLRNRLGPESGDALAYLTAADGDSINASLAELFCAADHGTVMGYELNDGSVHAVLAAQEDRQVLDWGLKLLQEGIVAFTAAMSDALPLIAANAQDQRAHFMKAGLAAVQRLIHAPTAAEARLLGSFPHSANQFHSSFSPLAPAVPAWMALRALIDPSVLATGTYWREATIAQSAPSPEMALRLWSARVHGLPSLKKRLRAVFNKSGG